MNLIRRTRALAIVCSVVVSILGICGTVSRGQSAAFATIRGQVLDSGGALVLGATIRATNTETGLARTTNTTSEGVYRFDELTPGIYDLTVESAGFARAEAKGVRLQVGEQRDVNFKLEVAGQTTSVVVTSEVPLIEATKTDVSTVIDDRAVADLPTTTSYQGLGGVANDYEGLATSAPGVIYDYSGNSADIVGPGSANDRGVVINIDGGNYSDFNVSFRSGLGASVEEVREFEVLTNGYNAEYGQAGNVILNIITKSGTNTIHGDAHGYFRGRNLGASDFFYNQTNCNQGLGTGPGSCDNKLDAGFPSVRAPFFKHEEGFTVGGPFVKNRVFWFASLERTAQGAPATFTPFNIPVTVNQPTDELLWSSKLDAKLTEKHTLSVRFNIQHDRQSNLHAQTGPNTDPSALTSFALHDQGLNISMISAISPNTINEARFFWHRKRNSTTDNDINPGQILPNAYVGANFSAPTGSFLERFQYIDNLSWTHNKHTMKVGMNFNHEPYQVLFQQFHFGAYQAFNAGGCEPFGLCPTQFRVGAGAGFVQSANTIYGVYIQDIWQIRKNVTLNYGIRYDIEDGALRGGTKHDPRVPGGCLQGNGLIPACGSDKNNWQPRLGIAWSPNFDHGLMHWIFGSPGQSVVRASGAEVTEMAFINVALDSLDFDGTNLLTATISAPSTSCFLANGNVNPAPPTADAAACAVLGAYPNSPSPISLVPFTTGGSVSSFGLVRPISPTIKEPEIHMASFSINRQLTPTFVFSVGYQGVFGSGLFGETDQNASIPVPDTRPGIPAGFFYLPARPNPLFGAIRTNFSNRTSSYNSLVLTAQKRVSHHFQFQGNYTFSKLLGTGEDFFGLSEPANPFVSLSQERAPMQNDVRHLANFNFVADTQGLVSNPVLKHIINNWTFGLLATLQSGRPYPVSTGDGPFAGSGFGGNGSETNQRPSVLPDGTLVATNIASSSGTNLEISQAGVLACQAAGLPNCSALQTTFIAPSGASTSGPVDSIDKKTPVDFQFLSGNLARDAGRTLPLYRFDVSLSKAFKIPKWESGSLELKLDVFNVFNHPLLILNNGNDVLNALSLPSLTVTNGSGVAVPNPNFNCTAACLNPFTGLYLGRNGQPLTMADFTSGRVDRNLNSHTTNFLGLGDPSGTVTPRIMQLAIRFRW
jgi:hypothetical protein